ncbi:MAG: hypothetical protein LKF96_07625 [Treponema sp.]|jgi:hypothetical protein|nr:hypothetical protein [Treponema sp.]
MKSNIVAQPDTRHLLRMTDSTGIFQHAVGGIPDPVEGYTSDDNARALITAVLLYCRPGDNNGKGLYENLIVRYLSFLRFAENNGWFRNFMGYDRNFLEKKGSEDSFGRCILALGYTAGEKRLPEYIREGAEFILRETFRSSQKLTFLKSKAYALAGLSFWNISDTKRTAELLADSIEASFTVNHTADWPWFENELTYCSGIMPFALLRARIFGKDYEKTGLESLEFLSSVVFRNGIFKPVGCNGWLKKGGTPAMYDEQPVEACNMQIACREAFLVTGRQLWNDRAAVCRSWYTGNNSAGISVIDAETGGCMDGIEQNGINRNQGAESLVCSLISQLI